MKNIFKKINLIASLAVVAGIVLGGCGYNVSFMIRNANMKDISTILKDYAGLSGYKMTYANDETGAYRIVVGRAIVPASEYSKTYFESNTLGTGENKTTVGESSSVNTSTPSQKQVAALAIQMSQQGSDVYINAQSTADLDASDQFKAFVEFLKGKGYVIEQIKVQSE